MIAPLQIDVGLGERRYPVRIGVALLSSGDGFRAAMDGALRGRHALIVSDGNVAPLHAASMQHLLRRDHPQMQVDVLVLPAGEAHKDLDAVARVFGALAGMEATRDACVIALGGGVVGDIAGFAAACWMRGIDFVQVPTTLLAMVDASVGGKTGVDLPQGKNLIGAFHQPRAVIADLDTLASLPDRELTAGFAEVVKTACIGDADFFAWLETHADALIGLNAQALTHAVATCCRFKAGVVERDERETGERALLNFGHTFGHAIETETGYGTLLHGESVAIGMMLAARLSAQLGMSGDADTDRLRALLQGFCLPTELPAALQPESLLARMRLDKKNRAGALRLILWRGIGRAEIVAIEDEAPLRRVLQPIQ
ncbi:MAG TPA: 3-dehydroquinate synthase [Rhodanobacteraceae bacterium]|nr:3-dehydroquinate synthase [Rhodanobacteraceae bacterium]